MNPRTLAGAIAVGVAVGMTSAVVEPVANAAPLADPVYCDVLQGSPGNGPPYGGQAHGPYADRLDHHDAIYATYHFRCTQNVTLLIHWNILSPDIGQAPISGNQIKQFGNIGPACSATTPCVADVTPPRQKITGSFNCTSEWSASGTADVYPANTPFPSGTPLQSFQILTSTAVPC
jgi:hypothetical protein